VVFIQNATAWRRSVGVTRELQPVLGPQLGAGSGACVACARIVSQAYVSHSSVSVFGVDVGASTHLDDAAVTLPMKRTGRIGETKGVRALDQAVNRADLE
jgi:hypothetical protein